MSVSTNVDFEAILRKHRSPLSMLRRGWFNFSPGGKVLAGTVLLPFALLFLVSFTVMNFVDTVVTKISRKA